MASAPPKPLTGTKVFIILLAFFGVVIGVNMTMMKLACSVVIATTFIGLRIEPSAESTDPSALPPVLDSFLAAEVHTTVSERGGQ